MVYILHNYLHNIYRLSNISVYFCPNALVHNTVSQIQFPVVWSSTHTSVYNTYNMRDIIDRLLGNEIIWLYYGFIMISVAGWRMDIVWTWSQWECVGGRRSRSEWLFGLSLNDGMLRVVFFIYTFFILKEFRGFIWVISCQSHSQPISSFKLINK